MNTPGVDQDIEFAETRRRVLTRRSVFLFPSRQMHVFRLPPGGINGATVCTAQVVQHVAHHTLAPGCAIIGSLSTDATRGAGDKGDFPSSRFIDAPHFLSSRSQTFGEPTQGCLLGKPPCASGRVISIPDSIEIVDTFRVIAWHEDVLSVRPLKEPG